MTTKINPQFMAPRIIIDVDAAGASTMNVKGNLNPIAVSMILASQLNALLPKIYKDLLSNSILTDAKGQPILNAGGNGQAKPETEIESTS